MAHTHESLCPTASVMLVSRASRMLFIRHKIYEKWLPPGGHVEPGQTKFEAAKRELWEETGIAIEGLKLARLGKLVDAGSFINSRRQPIPYDINAHEVQPGRFHEDSVYAVSIIDEPEINPQAFDESEEGEWMTPVEIGQLVEDGYIRNLAQNVISYVAAIRQ